jgi:hypothetical protein
LTGNCWQNFPFWGIPGIDEVVLDEIGYVEKWHKKKSDGFMRDKSSALSVTGVVDRWGGETVSLYSKRDVKRQ